MPKNTTPEPTTAQASPPEPVVEYLRSRGLLPDDLPCPATVTHLTGGVSGDAVLVEMGSTRVVVKRALDKLLVVDDWYAKPERAITEAAAIELLHGITPDQTPQLVDADPPRFTLVMTAAPAEWVNWKTVLMGAVADPTPGIRATAAQLGAVLGRWHAQTAGVADVAERFNDYEAFEQLRIGPFHRVIARRHPGAAPAVETCILDLESRRDCLVHGDYSPKNVLVGPETPGATGGLMVLDFEVAHYGAAVFDTAYMQCHLLMKAVHLPHQREQLRQAGRSFLDAYANESGTVFEPRQGWHTACLLLARVDGTSPSGYLTTEQEDLVRQLALDALRADEPTINRVWDMAFDRIADTVDSRTGHETAGQVST